MAATAVSNERARKAQQQAPRGKFINTSPCDTQLDRDHCISCRYFLHIYMCDRMVGVIHLQVVLLFLLDMVVQY